MTIEIKFTDISGDIAKEYYPQPAIKKMPKWFLDLPGNINGLRPESHHKLFGTPTAKRCVPMLDAFSLGYIISTASDLIVTERDGSYFYEWANEPGIDFQIIEQIGNHAGVGPMYNGIPKLKLPWSIKTPMGYSCLFIPPVNLDDRQIEIFSGVIDTDTYNVPGAFPFMFTNPEFTGLIPAGTPVIQVIPFKRMSYKMVEGSSNEVELSNAQFNKLRSVFRNGYRKLFWTKKHYS
jgi:hypothetical protein